MEIVRIVLPYKCLKVQHASRTHSVQKNGTFMDRIKSNKDTPKYSHGK